jgi:hypothetical protein
MDMKKILSAFDNATSTPKAGTSDMKKFLSIVNESAVAKESVVSFDEDSIGGDVNDFLIAADHINDLVMGNLDKIKINANEQLLKEVMSKFNEFMTAYHAVGKEILQPDLFDSVDNNQVDEAGYRGRRDAYQRDYDSSVAGMGKRDSLAYQLDGGANDEGWDEEPRQYRAPTAPSRGMYFYNVPAGKETDAEYYGLKKTKSGRWYSKTKSSILDKAFGPGRYWEPKNESLSLSIKDYFALEEAKQKGVDGKACWDGYKRMGTKKKGGKTVDNCVPTGKK